MPRRHARDTETLDLFAPRPPKPTPGTAPAPWQPPPFTVLDPAVIEIRPYFRCAFEPWAAGGNLGLVADTSTGKTYLAYALADAVLAAGARILFCAPTNVLCEQHAALARLLFRVDADDVRFVRAAQTPKRRAGAWTGGRILIATPQTAASALRQQLLQLDTVGLVIIDEGHHAARTHASIAVAEAAHAKGVRILALTASPGGTTERIERIRANLHLDRWVRIAEADTQAFQPPVHEQREIVPVADVAQPMVDQLGNLLERLTGRLVDAKVLEQVSRAPSPADLKQAMDRIRERKELTLLPHAAAAQQVAVVLMLIVADDYGVALRSLRRALEKTNDDGKATKASRRLLITPEIRAALEKLEALVRDDVMHPKQEALIRTIRGATDAMKRAPRVLVFDRYVDGCLRLAELLRRTFNVRVEVALGRSRMRPDLLIRTLHAFGCGEASILVGTDVIREGIHVPAIDLLVAYSPSRNELELIQLSGRVGRTDPGRIVTIITNHELDRRYAFSSAVRAQRMRGIIAPSPTGTSPNVGVTHHSAFTGHRRKLADGFVRRLRGRFVFERFKIVQARVERGRRAYVRMLVGDRTGAIPLLRWCPKGADEADRVIHDHPVGTIVIVSGTYEDGRSPRIIVNPSERQGIMRCPDGDYDPADYDRTPTY
ncbi:DEAD/DEAH box helicase family protein [Candidatus Uhrbacteria bacterium]|nr:DEAD/DEAH box helicase family protein [Candidatus Uhrbacteria bacterium]